MTAASDSAGENTPKIHSPSSRVGVVLSGGGARGAYQAGVMKAVGEIATQARIDRPVPIVTGVSAGAINAAFLGSQAHRFNEAVNDMANFWSNLHADEVFRTDAFSAGRLGIRFFADATFGALYRKKLARSLLDTSPLGQLLDRLIDFSQIEANVRSGHLRALAVTAMNYSNANSITFVQGQPDIKMWQRSRRLGEPAKISREHVMASAAIPLFFPPIPLEGQHFGDGCLRNSAPLSPAIHLGAERLLVVSVRRADKPTMDTATPKKELEPSIARVLGVIMNALMLDATELDMERLSRINSTINFVPERQRSELKLKKVDYLWIRPSQDIGELAGDLFDKLPTVIRYLVSGLGSSREAAELTSYLLFDPEFCGKLIEIGYQDGLAHAQQIRDFITPY